MSVIIALLVSLLNIVLIAPSKAQESDYSGKNEEFDLKPGIIENSPVIREWMQEIPDVANKIKYEPSFVTRYRFGYTQFPSNNNIGGIFLGVEDVFMGNTPLTFSAKYSQDLSNSSHPQDDRLSVGANIQYYLLPLGSYVNIAPMVGYRYIETAGYNTGGVNVGVRLGLIFSPQGGGDIFISQSFISPTGNEEVGITEINVGYAISKNLRLSTEIGWQNSIKQNDSQVSIGLEWKP